MIGVCTHLGCVPLGTKPGDPRGEYRRLVLPLPRLAVRHVGPHPQGPGAAATSRFPTTCSLPTPSFASADRPTIPLGARSNGLVSRRSAGLQEQGDRLDRSPPADLLATWRRSITPSRRRGTSTTGGISARIATVMLVLHDRRPASCWRCTTRRTSTSPSTRSSTSCAT